LKGKRQKAKGKRRKVKNYGYWAVVSIEGSFLPSGTRFNVLRFITTIGLAMALWVAISNHP
jgi:hypothetical protein